MRFDVVYQPKGAALEYSAWACNAVKLDDSRNCSHGCLYCYNRPGSLPGPIVKENFFERLERDLAKLKGVIKPGERLELTFVGDIYDPTLPGLARHCLELCKVSEIPFQVLTKNGIDSVKDFDLYGPEDLFGVTLTCDNDSDSLKWEPGASLWSMRLEALKEAHSKGVKTWVSFEPVVDPAQTLRLIKEVLPYADIIKVGKMNSKGKQTWHNADIKAISQNTDWRTFGEKAIEILKAAGKEYYIKDDLLAFLPEATAQQRTPDNSPPVTNKALKKAALDYAARGWRVIPLYDIKSDGSCACGRPECDGNSRGKHPRITEWQTKASSDPKKIEHWWGVWPHSNVGVMCGQDTGFMVVDVDGPTGEDSLKDREWPKTQKVKTGRGCHYHLKWPKLDFTLKNNAGILPGVDIKVGKGQVAMPPSQHYNGSVYEWEVGPDECELAEAPAWFVQILKEKYAPKKRLEENIKKIEERKKDAINNRYAQRALEDEVAAVALASEGTRNDQLNKSAFSLATLVASGALNEDEVERQLTRAAKRSGLKDAEIEATLKSAFHGGKAHPREIPEPPKFNSAPEVEVKKTPPKKKRHYTLNNRGNVERLLDLHKEDLKYVREFKDWIRWTGKRWERDETAPYMALDDVVNQLYEEARKCEDDGMRKKLASFAAQCGNNSTYAATVALASKNPEFSISVLELDADDCKINLQNGMLDLRTFQLLPHSPDAKLMKITQYGYDELAKCCRWDQFLNEVFKGDVEVIDYIRRVVGYSMTGSMAEKCFFFLYGPEGDNGKSKFLEVLRDLMGEYAKNADISTFLTSKNEKVRDDLAALYGARIVTAAEPEEGTRFAMAVIKPWTGGDPQTCRELYGKIFTYTPKGKIFLAANNKPAIYERTDAAWSRVHLIPFMVSFAKEQQDKDLSEKLRKEMPGILNWAIQGLKDYRTLGGLYPPEAIRKAVSAYRRENDSVRVFIEEVCIFDSDWEMGGPMVYASYKEFCMNAGLKPLGLGKFNGAMLDACSLKGVKREKKAAGYMWKGLKVPLPAWHGKESY